VQVLTVHGSKGLEWDLVAVPRLVTDELPAKPQETTGWLRAGVLPWQFRGDAAQLPVFGWRSAPDRKALQEELGRFKAEVRERHLKEERRLAYVAVTRARHRLLLSGSFWASQTSSRAPSLLLQELAEDGLLPPLPEGPVSETKPADADPGRFTWPRDPLGGRRPALEAAAQAVRDADPAAPTRWSVEIDALLAERAELLAGRGQVVVPPRVPASRFKDYIDDAAAVAAGLRRPMPERPYRQTRLGTLFHAWVEERSKRTGATELLDAFLGERDEELDLPVAGLEELQANFAASPWGALEPLEVETEIQLPFAGRIVVCKLDAVYRREGRIEIVDWKTGRPPKDAADLELKQYQLALYRLAYAKREGIDPESVDALFYYVAADEVVRPQRIYSERELRERWSSVVSGTVLA
jgi:DNA helicase-2/ATP-dependent DNA helicase PcrA